MIHLSEEQENAVELCVDDSKIIVCVTGQAGTGKTTILKKAYDKFVEEFGNNINSDGKPINIALCAPTGRAAKRIEEVTGYSAMTIHRLLRFSVPEDDSDFGLPAHSKLNPMPYRVVFVDEASMLTVMLRRQLIDACKKGCLIRFFGDINQLPPIDTESSTHAFSPFAADIDRFPSAVLTTNFRSTDGIIALADRVIKNKMPLSNEQVKIERVVGAMGSNKVMALAETIDFTSENNQIICPTNATTHGTENINRAIQQRFNPNKEKITVFRTDKEGNKHARSFKMGDKILWTYNDYNVGIMNGTLGKVVTFDKETGSIFLDIEGRDVEIPSQIKSFNPTTGLDFIYDPRQYLDLGYAISTHKSQGSQFETVCYVISRTRAATRQNVYTAVTRAKERLYIINIAGSLSFALENLVNIYEKK